MNIIQAPCFYCPTLKRSGEISEPDGLPATWFHRANSKDEMNKALASGAMILESDVTLQGQGTPSQKPIPIMAHPPDIYSDNTLDQWLDAVLASRKAMKLDFKYLEAVGLSLDLLGQKNISRGINRPVWLNADIIHGPNVHNTINLFTFFFFCRFSLTLWQGDIHPNISDLLFVRDNTHPARVYYDIYEPTLSEFKQAAIQLNLIQLV
uniref:Protein FAM151A n=1 Tax=Dicentrarchus labrax TaxID=13489 RepID=A0A8C4D8Q5_DICLA